MDQPYYKNRDRQEMKIANAGRLRLTCDEKSLDKRMQQVDFERIFMQICGVDGPLVIAQKS